MSLSAGTRVGAYEILGLLGAGGMGEVYRARDARLQRDVAIKVLPTRFASDAERLARFEREAQVLASLNHLHIAAIYGFQESDGIRALVLELVDGETLADRIARGPLSYEDARAIAIQIAAALAGAHQHGVIHRDLKPSNVKVTPQGTVKVLDFGLAKLAGPEGRISSDVTMSPTITSPAMVTGAGVVLGTAAYMAPEQAKGRAADSRSDIWAFGCVLYEMLTGRRPFDGNDASDMLASVLRAEPDWTRLPADTPDEIRRLLVRCLRKDPQRRLQSAADAAIELEDALAAHITRDVSGSRIPERLIWAAALLFCVGVGAVGWIRSSNTGATADERRLHIPTPTAASELGSFAISPDGSRVVYAAADDGQPHLVLRRLDSFDTEVLPGTEAATDPFWSPDGNSVAFFAQGRLKRLDLGERRPRVLADAPFGHGGAWNQQGTILFAANAYGPLWKVDAAGGGAEPVTKLDGTTQGHRYPYFLPDGRRFLFHVTSRTGERAIRMGSLDGSESRHIVDADSTAVYRANGWLLFVVDGALVTRQFDLSTVAFTGPAKTIVESVRNTSRRPAFSAALDGPLLFRAGGGNERDGLVWFDRSGKRLSNFTTAGVDSVRGGNLDLLFDGRVAVDRVVDGNQDVWLVGPDGPSKLTLNPAPDWQPLWSPDGRSVVFASARDGSVFDLYVKPADGAAPEEPLLKSEATKTPNDWSSDGRYLLFHSRPVTGQTVPDLWVLPLNPPGKPRTLRASPSYDGYGQFSPDDKWVAYQSNMSGRFEIYVTPFPGPGEQRQVSIDGGIQARWSRDGRELYFIAPDGWLMASRVTTKGDAFSAGPPQRLFFPNVSGGGISLFRPGYDIASDGRFLVSTLGDSTAAPPISVILDWKPPSE